MMRFLILMFNPLRALTGTLARCSDVPTAHFVLTELCHCLYSREARTLTQTQTELITSATELTELDLKFITMKMTGLPFMPIQYKLFR